MSDFKLLIIDWYRQNKRDLPWRETQDPFNIWLSEVILQQTRVDQGLPYYLKFIDRFDNIQSLAKAEEKEVLTLWQGLGYYSRGRNMHQTARIITEDCGGKFPNTSTELKKLKGIGPYTAAAIASFCFNEPVPVVDGNVYRVLSRYFDVEIAINSSTGIKLFSELAASLIDKTNPATYNQAIMEFGALQCVPKNPNCESCPLKDGCLARKSNTVHLRPVKLKKTKIKDRYFHFAVIADDKKVILEERSEKDIWQHLFQFPLTETPDENPPELLHPGLRSTEAIKISVTHKHILSHQRLFARFYHFDIHRIDKSISKNLRFVAVDDLSDFPLPRLIDKYIESNPFT